MTRQAQLLAAGCAPSPLTELPRLNRLLEKGLPCRPQKSRTPHTNQCELIATLMFMGSP